MAAASWTVGTAVAILVAIATAFRSLRNEMRLFRASTSTIRIDAQGNRIDAQGKELRERIDAQGKEVGEQIGQLRERMAKLEGLLEGVCFCHRPSNQMGDFH